MSRIPKLPERPDFIDNDDVLSIYQKFLTYHDEIQTWHREVFGNAVEVGCAQDYYSRSWQAATQYAPNKITHTALLINIRPIKEESDSFQFIATEITDNGETLFKRVRK